jgi:hypothetical protein
MPAPGTGQWRILRLRPAPDKEAAGGLAPGVGREETNGRSDDCRGMDEANKNLAHR